MLGVGWNALRAWRRSSICQGIYRKDWIKNWTFRWSFQELAHIAQTKEPFNPKTIWVPHQTLPEAHVHTICWWWKGQHQGFLPHLVWGWNIFLPVLRQTRRQSIKENAKGGSCLLGKCLLETVYSIQTHFDLTESCNRREPAQCLGWEITERDLRRNWYERWKFRFAIQIFVPGGLQNSRRCRVEISAFQKSKAYA
jgi:hypothetical protein